MKLKLFRVKKNKKGNKTYIINFLEKYCIMSSGRIMIRKIILGNPKKISKML